MGLSHALVWLCAACCAVAPISAPPATAQPVPGWGLPQLMDDLSRVQSSSARFTESQTMHLLNEPLRTSGTLQYVAPDWMQKTTISPVPERFVLSRGQVTITGGTDNQTHVFSLSDYPQIGGLVEGVLATLSGNLAVLDHFYVVRLVGGPRAWQLQLQPRGEVLTRFIAWLRIGGDGNRIESIDAQNSNGDHSEMSVVEDVDNAG